MHHDFYALIRVLLLAILIASFFGYCIHESNHAEIPLIYQP